MKTTNVADLKSRLSFFLRLVKKGNSILVKDRSEIVAELIPFKGDALSKKDQLIKEGKIIAALAQSDFSFSPTKKKVDVLELLEKVRED